MSFVGLGRVEIQEASAGDIVALAGIPEITIGETLGKTKEICFGYFNNPYCKPLLDMADETTMELDFWYLIA